jgi:DNA ligase-1
MSLFSTLVELGEQLAATKKKLEHRALIAAYLKSLPPDEIAIAARLLIGRIFPESDARVLNLSGAAVSHVVGQIVGKPEWDQIRAVDFGDAVEKLLTRHKHTPRGEPLSLMQAYRAYEQIAEESGEGARERKERELRELLESATAREAKYIVKQVIGEMRVGVSEGTLLDAIADASGVAASAIRRANQTSGDVGAVAQIAITAGAHGLSRLGVRVGVPLKPMLAQSAADVRAAFEKMDGAPFALEYKFDGARVQIHKRGEEVNLFPKSRTRCGARFARARRFWTGR